MLEDVRLYELFKIQDHTPYVNLFNFVKRKKSFRFLGVKHTFVSISDMQFDQVVKVRKSLSKDTISVQDIIMVFKSFFPSWLPDRAYLLMRVTTFFPAYNQILDTIKEANQSESLLWSAQYSDPDFKKAGSDNLSKFDTYNIVAEIAEKYGFRPDKVYKWTYGEIFIEVARNTTHADVMRAYQEIKTNKSKVK